MVMSFQRILIAIDESSDSEKTAACGLSLAAQLGATPGLIFVVDKDREVINADLGVTPEESLEALRGVATRTLEAYKAISRFMPTGEPLAEILKVIAEWPADLVVVGMHMRFRLQRSLADGLIHRAGVPVLVVRM